MLWALQLIKRCFYWRGFCCCVGFLFKEFKVYFFLEGLPKHFLTIIMSLYMGFITLETLEKIKKDLLEALAQKKKKRIKTSFSLSFYYVAWNKCWNIVFKLSVFGGSIRKESKAANTTLAIKERNHNGWEQCVN